MGGGRSRRPAGQRDQARRRVLGRPRPHLLLRAAEAPCPQRRANGGREDALLPPLPLRPPRRPRRRLLDGRTLANRTRAVAQRLPHRLERESLDTRGQGARRAAREAGRGEQRRAQPRPRRPEGRTRGARDTVRRRGRPRPAHGESPPAAGRRRRSSTARAPVSTSPDRPSRSSPPRPRSRRRSSRRTRASSIRGTAPSTESG